MPYADLELSLLRSGDDYTAELRFRPANGAAEAHPVRDPLPRVRLDPEGLLALGADPDAYGERLTAMLFADRRLREAVAEARGQAEGMGVPLRVRLRLDAGDDTLHGLAWETVHDPERGGFLFGGERVLVSRYLDSFDMTPVERRPRGELTALVAVANPTNLAEYGLAPVDVEGEVARTRAALRGIRTTVVARELTGTGADLANIAASLRDGPDILYLVCHGTSRQGRPYLWLEGDDGALERVEGAAFARRVVDLPRRPALVVLASCQSAGQTQDGGTLAALGPQLAAAGIAAVVAMQGNIGVETVTQFMRQFFGELRRDGQIDRALAAARGAVLDRPDWWVPVLLLRLRDGQLWADSSPTRVTTIADARERRNRGRMLERVRHDWLEGLLENSLQGAALIELGLEDKPDAVPDRWGMVVQQPDQPARPLAAGRTIADAFDALDGELLILGTPGAGKTTMLLDLARTLIARAEQDDTLPIPVVFPLSPWAEERLPIADWLVTELNDRYHISPQIGRGWVDGDQILPLLDGLDEVELEHRAACVGAINAFREGRGQGLASLVVCSRVADYEALRARLQLRGAVLLQPLSAQQIDQYLASAGGQLAGLRAALRGDGTLRELAESPLLLSIMTLAYRGVAVESLPATGGVDERRSWLFAAYVDRMFARRGANARYPREQTIRWLAWLAGALTRQAQTVFYLERLQPDWLPTRASRVRYTLVDRLGSAMVVGLVVGLISGLAHVVAYAPIVGLIVGLIGALIFGLIAGLIGGLVAGLFGGKGDTRSESKQGTWRRGYGMVRAGGGLAGGLIVGLAGGLAGGLIVGLIDGLAFGLGCGLLGGLAGGLAGGPGVRPRRITVVETVRWSRSRALWSALVGLVVGLVVGLAVGLAGGLRVGPPVGLLVGPQVGPPIGLAFGLIFGLVGGLTGGEVEAKVIPNQGIRRSARRAILVGLAFGLAVELAALVSGLGFGLVSGLFFGLVGALSYGGYACMSHLALRIVLWRGGAMPLDYVGFLDYATERIFLRRVGGGYIFLHRLLQEHFAAHEQELIARAASPTERPLNAIGSAAAR